MHQLVLCLLIKGQTANTEHVAAACLGSPEHPGRIDCVPTSIAWEHVTALATSLNIDIL